MPRLVWNLESPAPPGPTWEVFSDTERLMATAGVVHTYFDEPLPDGGVRRMGRAGDLEWEEPPFQFVKGRWLRSERNFTKGPACQLVLLLRLKERDDGRTDVRFCVDIEPRSLLTRPLVELGLAKKVETNIGAALPLLMERLQAPELGFGPACAVLSEEQEATIREGCAQLGDPRFGDALQELLLHGSSAELLHVAPLDLAPRWGLDPDATIASCVEGVEAGLLAMQWELLCPFCRGGQPLAGDIRRVHCPACNITFDGTLPDGVELSFRPADGIRTMPSAPSCPGSPVWRPHTLLQERLQPGATVERELRLDPGVLRVRGWPMRGAASLEVREGGPAEVVVEVRPSGVLPVRQVVGSGDVKLVLQSSEDRVVDVAIERRTTGRLLTAGRVRDLVGAPSTLALMGAREQQRRGLVGLERMGAGKDDLSALLQHLGPRTVIADEHRLVATFEDVDQALSAAIACSGTDDVSVGLGVGVVAETDARVIGDAAELVIAAARFGWPEPAVPVAQAGAFESVLAERRLRVTPTRASDDVLRVRDAFAW